MQKFKMIAKNDGKLVFGKKCPMTVSIPGWGGKYFIEIALSHTVSEIHAIFAEFQNACQKWQERIFWAESGE